MKFRRTIILCVAMALCLTMLTGCVTLRKKYNKFDAADIASIEVYDLSEYENRNSRIIEEIEPIYTLEKEQNEAFLNRLAQIEFTDVLVLLPMAVDPSFHYGNWTVRINFSNGSYQIISSAGYGESYDAEKDKEGSNHYGCDNDEWNEFVTDFLPDELIINN